MSLLDEMSAAPEVPDRYYVEVNFPPLAERPERIFDAMAQLIRAFQSVDQHLAESISMKIEPSVLLERIEAGSLRAWLITALKLLDDDALKKGDFKGVVGSYLQQGKIKLLSFLEGKTDISDPKQLETLEAELVELAEDTHVRQIPTYSRVPRRALLEDLNALSAATANLQADEKAVAVLDGERHEVPRGFEVAPEDAELLLTARSIDNESEMILKIKKPDYLGQSMWEFRHDGRTIEAKVADSEWLRRFHDREFVLGPGDAIKATVRMRVNYDNRGNVISTHREITSVSEVIAMSAFDQDELW